MTPPLKLLFVATAYPTDEAPYVTPWLHATLKVLVQEGYDVRVLTSAFRGRGDEVRNGIPVYRFRYAPRSLENLTHEVAAYERIRLEKWRYLQVPVFLGAGWIKGWRVRREFTPDLVHVHWPIPNLVWALPFARVPWVVSFHHSEIALVQKFPFLRTPFRRLIRRARARVFNSEFTRRRFHEVFGDLPGREEVIPMPVGWKPQVPPDVPRDPHRVLFVGRAVYWKGGELLIRAVKILRDQGMPLQLVFAGDGPALSEWRALARSLHVPAEFLGWVGGGKLSEEYARAQVLVLPSRGDPRVSVESLGLVLVEAMLHKTPVIASRLGGPAEIVDEGKTGWLFAPEDVEDLARKLSWIFRYPEKARGMGEEGYRQAQRFLPEAVATRHRKLYEEILYGESDLSSGE